MSTPSAPLSRADLVIEDRTPDEYAAWLEPWKGHLEGRLSPILLNRFGCWFLKRRDGSVELFDVFFGHLEPVAASPEAFHAQLDEPSWQEVYLLSRSVRSLHRAGQRATDRSCYAIAPPPLAGGPDPWAVPEIDPGCTMLMDVMPWQSLCAQVVRASAESAG